MSENELKLYVWDNVLIGHFSGMALALAETVEQARDVIMQKHGEKSYRDSEHHTHLWKSISSEPKIFQTPVGFAI